MLIISDLEAIRFILQGTRVQEKDRHARYACYLGAGASAEAGVSTAWQICTKIHDELLKTKGLLNPRKKEALREWEDAVLNWNDSTLRYVSCIKEGYPNRATRVEFFRDMLRSVAPSFCHYALALLTTHRYFKSTCLTTNFDKLLESAFTQENSECQPIRTDEEVEYWANVEERRYVIKLHGDYDTHNILNTSDETVSISENIQGAVASLLEFAGLVVIGTAGYEKSVHTMFDLLSSRAIKEKKVLRLGLLWGVYMGSSKPQHISSNDLKRLVLERVNQGEVSRDIKGMIERTNRENPLFCFFPVWGAGNFMFDLIKATDDAALQGAAEIYLDRKMRLRRVFSDAGLSEEAINKHISALETKRSLPEQFDEGKQIPEKVYAAHNRRKQIEVRIMYGDITNRTFMNSDEFRLRRRAVVSPDDIFLSAGGGVAELLLVKAGQQSLLNELAKFSQIEQGAIAVTSAGKLPVHYIFHAAAVRVNKDASYTVSKQIVYAATLEILEKASALDINALWIPLMGAGVGNLNPTQSLESILKAIGDWKRTSNKAIAIMIFIYREKTLPRHLVLKSLQSKLKSQFTITKFS